jgi:hypothetical protein
MEVNYFDPLALTRAFEAGFWQRQTEALSVRHHHVPPSRSERNTRLSLMATGPRTRAKPRNREDQSRLLVALKKAIPLSRKFFSLDGGICCNRKHRISCRTIDGVDGIRLNLLVQRLPITPSVRESDPRIPPCRPGLDPKQSNS